MWNVAAIFRRSPGRRAGWWTAAVLGALLVLPAVPAAGDAPRGERSSSPKASSSKSSGSRSSGSKASSRSSSSRPRASSRSASGSRSRPQARSQKRSAPKSRPQARSQKRSAPKSRPQTKSRTRSRPEGRNRTITTERARPNRPSRETATERARPDYQPRHINRERNRPNRPSGEVAERTTPDYQPRNINTERNRPNRPILTFDPERPGAPNERPTTRRNDGPAFDRDHPIEEIDGQPPGPRHQIDRQKPDGASSSRRREGRPAPGPRHRDGRNHHGYNDHHRHHHHYGCGHYGYGYDPYYWGFGPYYPFYPFSSYWDVSLGYYSSHGYGYGAPDVYVGGGGGGSYGREVGMGALDLDIKPRKAEVYVDGSFIGVADQYDGFPAYLWLEEGTHEVAFYMEGYQTIFRRYTIYPGVTIDVDDRMREGQSIHPTGPALEAPASRDPGPSVVPRHDGGRIAVAATPGDAAVYLDGHFVGTAAEIATLGAGLIVEPGDHLVEVIRPGYETRSMPISVAAGERIDLKLDLELR